MINLDSSQKNTQTQSFPSCYQYLCSYKKLNISPIMLYIYSFKHLKIRYFSIQTVYRYIRESPCIHNPLEKSTLQCRQKLKKMSPQCLYICVYNNIYDDWQRRAAVQDFDSSSVTRLQVPIQHNIIYLLVVLCRFGKGNFRGALLVSKERMR